MSDFFKDVRHSSTAEIKNFIISNIGNEQYIRNFKNDDGLTVLHFAALHVGNSEVVKVLISMGANVNAEANEGATPLHATEDAEIVNVLVSSGANIDAKLADGRTPLFFAIENEKNEAAIALVNKGADINLHAEIGLTPLEMAIYKGNIDILRIIIPRISDINKKDENNLTLLHKAMGFCLKLTKDKNVEIAKLLISNGADINSLSNKGTALDLAKELGNTVMVDFLSSQYNQMQQNPSNAEQLRLRGIEYYDANDFDRAIIEFDQSISLDRNNAKTYNNRGLAYRRKYDFENAIINFDHAIRIDPKFVNAYVNRGFIFQTQDHPNKALADYTTAIQIDPNIEYAYIYRGDIYSVSGIGCSIENNNTRANEFFDLAISDYNKAIQNNQNNNEAYYCRGKAYKQKDDFDQAISDFTISIDLSNDNSWIKPLAYSERGEAYRSKKDIEKALEDFAKSIQLDQNNPYVFLSRANMYYYDLSDFSNTIKDLETALKIDPNIDVKYLMDKAKSRLKHMN